MSGSSIALAGGFTAGSSALLSRKVGNRLVPTKAGLAMRVGGMGTSVYGMYKGAKEEGLGGFGKAFLSDIGGSVLGGITAGATLVGTTKLAKVAKARRAARPTRTKNAGSNRGNVVFRKIGGRIVPIKKSK